MTATTTKLFAAITFTFTAALLSMGCETVIATEDQAILGDACNPAEIAGVLDLETNVIDHTDAEFGQYEIDPIVMNPSGVTWEQMDLILDELCVDVRHPDALDTPARAGRDYRGDAADILADTAPADGELHDDNLMKSGGDTVGRKPARDFGAGIDREPVRDFGGNGIDRVADRDFDGFGRDADRDFGAQVQAPGKPHADLRVGPDGDRRDAPEQTAQCYETSHPVFGNDCLLCCTGPDCYMTCVDED